MFIGHLPAGYLLTRWLQKRLKTNEFLWIGLLASVFPDIDMVYFYVIDHQQTLHHHYWTHLPLFWIALWVTMGIVAKLLKLRTMFVGVTIVFANILLHFVLDSVVGGILWLSPFTEYSLALVTVPAKYDFWILSFVFHWTFLLELAILLIAIAKFWRDRSRRV